MFFRGKNLLLLIQRVGHETECCSLGKKLIICLQRVGHETESCSLGKKNSLLWLSCLQRVRHETESCSLEKKNSLLWLSCLQRVRHETECWSLRKKTFHIMVQWKMQIVMKNTLASRNLSAGSLLLTLCIRNGFTPCCPYLLLCSGDS